MKTIITHTGDFVRAVEVNPIAAQAGSYQLQFSSQLRSARNPQEWRSNFAVILNTHELAALQKVIQAALESAVATEQT